MRIVCVSDTHDMLNRVEVPDGDVLVHAGDMTMWGEFDDVAAFADHLAALPHRYKVVIAGNHDFLFEREPEVARRVMSLGSGYHYLQDSWVEIDGVKFYGAPWVPRLRQWAFYNADPASKWVQIPDDTDVLVTHGPPLGILDDIGGEAVGCEHLLANVRRVRPRLHVFGHIHESYGTLEDGGTKFVNAAVCTRQYRPTNAPVVVEI